MRQCAEASYVLSLFLAICIAKQEWENLIVNAKFSEAGCPRFGSKSALGLLRSLRLGTRLHLGNEIKK